MKLKYAQVVDDSMAQRIGWPSVVNSGEQKGGKKDSANLESFEEVIHPFCILDVLVDCPQKAENISQMLRVPGEREIGEMWG
jgi:hypothetical protein